MLCNRYTRASPRLKLTHTHRTHHVLCAGKRRARAFDAAPCSAALLDARRSARRAMEQSIDGTHQRASCGGFHGHGRCWPTCCARLQPVVAKEQQCQLANNANANIPRQSTPTVHGLSGPSKNEGPPCSTTNAAFYTRFSMGTRAGCRTVPTAVRSRAAFMSDGSDGPSFSPLRAGTPGTRRRSPGRAEAILISHMRRMHSEAT